MTEAPVTSTLPEHQWLRLKGQPREPQPWRIFQVVEARPETLYVHLGMDGDNLLRENEGRDVFLRGTVAYPGSKVTDILIGGQTVQMSNPCLRRALGEDTTEGDAF